MRIGISLGDVTGIGPEVTLKALAEELPRDSASYLIVGDTAVVSRLNDVLKTGIDLGNVPLAGTIPRVAIHDPVAEPLPEHLTPGAAAAATAAIAWVRHAGELCLRGELDGMVTAPVNKEAIIRAGINFVGQTEYLSNLAGVQNTVMMLLGHDDRGRWLRVALVTTHLAIRNVAQAITQAKVELAIDRASAACRDLGLPRARVAVCGLNPHAGEGGKIGDEELLVVGPAVAACRARGLDVVGPVSADTLFHGALKGNCDAVVAMYHDQGLAPLKMVAFDSGVNWTLGLPFVRTSPDHGTAYDIAGRGIAEPSSMVAAIRLAKQLAAVRRG
ncbi:MAG TPA: 4-hydroxythreonine-4-phosphate dehydrogenase PdxA [Verrucomicrobiae bacterium]|nr:4-hydroxythreonine-4-phosphate dehydrogenase PdxA [Verrucomicrobiae bacterium]